MKHNKYLFLTEREALDFINAEFGENAVLKASTITSETPIDNDGLPFSWGGETAAYIVNNEALVGYYEPLGVNYTVTLGGVSIDSTSLYEAREVSIPWITEIAEDVNFAGTIVLAGNDGIIEEIEVELFDEEEPAADDATFQKVFNRRLIGKQIREARQQTCLSIRDLAAKVGMSKNNISRIEQGEYGYSIDTLATIAHALGLNLKLAKN